MDLSTLKYQELQKLAKKHGIKANMKIDKLRAALSEFYRKEEDTTNEKETKTKSIMSMEASKQKSSSTSKGSEKREDQQNESVKSAATPHKMNVEKCATQKQAKLSGKQKQGPVSTPNLSQGNKGKLTAKPKQANKGKSTDQTQENKEKTTPEVEAPTRKRKATEGQSSDKKRARRGTFECEPSPGLHTPEVTAPAAKGDKSTSPGTKELIAAMKPDMSADEMKLSLMNAIDEKIKCKSEGKTEEGKSDTSAGKETQIPRFMLFLEKRKQASKASPSPGAKRWNKIHKKEFDKMESIEDYLERKKKRQEEYSSSVKKTKKLLEETRMAMKRLQDQSDQCNPDSKRHRAKLFPTPGSTTRAPAATGKAPGSTTRAPGSSTRAPFKPTVLSTKEMNLNFAGKTPQSSDAKVKPFKPSVISTKDMNLNFSKVTTPQTIPRKSPRNSSKNENLSCSSKIERKSTGTAPKKTASTPFKFTATLNQTLNNTMSAKKSFDLKASLAKPVTWKTHKGKLKPFKMGHNSYITNTDANSTICSHNNRSLRQVEQGKKREESRFNSSMMRRGIPT